MGAPIEAFPSDRALRKQWGWYVEVEQSGTRERSRLGSGGYRGTRRELYLFTMQLIAGHSGDNPFKHYYRRLINGNPQPKAPKVALGHLASKLTTVMYVCMKRRESYDPSEYAPALRVERFLGATFPLPLTRGVTPRVWCGCKLLGHRLVSWYPFVMVTHLAVALGLRGIEHGLGVYFVRASDLLEDLRRAQSEHRLDRRMRVYIAPRILIIDEFGVWPNDRVAATAFFSLVAARYERGSIILTSNKGFADWGEVLGDPVIATAILDRLLHHSHVLNICGESYRLREKERAGLMGNLAPQQEVTAGDLQKR